MAPHTSRDPEYYQYAELLDGTSHEYKKATIRVLCIQPGGAPSSSHNQTNLVCSTELVDLNDPNSEGFEALSYAWGVEKPECAILLNGQTFFIRRNLATILHHLRRENEVRRIWIDAVCINQGNEFEKSYQVRMMKNVYQHAWRTIIWLGVESDGSSIALQRLHLLGVSMLQIYENLGLSTQKMAETHPEDGSDGAFARMRRLERAIDVTLRTVGYDDDEWLPLINPLLTRPWFSRAWIRQEVTESTNAVINCGPATLDWKFFANGILLLAHRSELAMMNRSKNSMNHVPNMEREAFDNIRWLHVASLIMFCDLYQSSGGRGVDYRKVISHLTVTNFPECGDLRDRVFAFVGLANNLKSDAPELWNIVPNYKLSPEEVYARATRAIIDLSWNTPADCLRILTFCSRSRQRLVGLPSWVPDWNQPFKPNIARHFGEQIFVADLNIGPNQIGWTREKMFPDAQTLRLLGVEFGEIFEIGRTFEDLTGGRDFLTSDSFVAWSRECMNLWSYRASTYRTEAEMCDLRLSHLHRDFQPYAQGDRKVAKTLIMDMSINNLSLEETYGPQFARRRDCNRAEDFEVAMFDVFIGATPVPESFLPGSNITSNERNLLFISDYLSLAFDTAAGRRPVMLDNGYIGLVPSDSEPGDVLVIFYGAPIPFVLRDHGDYCEIIGGCYIHGAMDGEIVSAASQHKRREFMLR